MKVQLRNKSGQFCNLEEFCAEERDIDFPTVIPIDEATELLPELRKRLIEIKVVAEVIEAFGLERQGGWICGGIRLKLLKNGKFISSDCLSAVLQDAEDAVKKAEKLSATWAATEYTVEV